MHNSDHTIKYAVLVDQLNKIALDFLQNVTQIKGFHFSPPFLNQSMRIQLQYLRSGTLIIFLSTKNENCNCNQIRRTVQTIEWDQADVNTGNFGVWLFSVIHFVPKFWRGTIRPRKSTGNPWEAVPCVPWRKLKTKLHSHKRSRSIKNIRNAIDVYISVQQCKYIFIVACLLLCRWIHCDSVRGSILNSQVNTGDWQAARSLGDVFHCCDQVRQDKYNRPKQSSSNLFLCLL